MIFVNDPFYLNITPTRGYWCVRAPFTIWICFLTIDVLQNGPVFILQIHTSGYFLLEAPPPPPWVPAHAWLPTGHSGWLQAAGFGGKPMSGTWVGGRKGSGKGRGRLNRQCVLSPPQLKKRHPNRNIPCK